MKRIGAATALEVRATGIPYVFAPCIAVTKLIKLMIAIGITDYFLTEVVLLYLCRFVEILDGVVAMKATVKTPRLFKQ